MFVEFGIMKMFSDENFVVFFKNELLMTVVLLQLNSEKILL